MSAPLATITLTPEAQELIAFAHTFLGTAQAVKITSPEDAQAAVDQTRQIKECGKAIEEARKEKTKPLDDEKKAWMDAFRPATEVLDKAEGLLKNAISAWNLEQRRIAQEAEALRRKLEQEEQARLAKEQKDAEALLEKADEAAASGDIAAAEALENQAMAIQESTSYVPATPAPASTKIKGASSRQVWKCRIVDPSRVPRQWCAPDEKALDAYAKAMKDKAEVEGCEFYAEESVSIR